MHKQLQCACPLWEYVVYILFIYILQSSFECCVHVIKLVRWVGG